MLEQVAENVAQKAVRAPSVKGLGELSAYAVYCDLKWEDPSELM